MPGARGTWSFLMFGFAHVGFAPLPEYIPLPQPVHPSLKAPHQPMSREMASLACFHHRDGSELGKCLW